ncbi:Transketolase [Handroanthus impetiginosus]|uniref:Transketolase n=1 Tax=Handroanthus impetiginosus TaxID=429701 RepID=A0A2G9HLK9_9LAMI|nr:Transketolase [Handroanthus impetiginosus]
MAAASCHTPFRINSHFHENSGLLSPKLGFSVAKFASNVELGRLSFSPSLASSKEYVRHVHASPNADDFINEKEPTPMLDMIEGPMNLKNLTMKELKKLAHEIRSELSFMSKAQEPVLLSLSVVELTVAIHYVFNAPVDKILWDIEDQKHAHKLLTGRRPFLNKDKLVDDRAKYSCRSEFDPFGAGHGCSSISSGLGMAVARELKGKKDRIVAVISNETRTTGQLYEAMSNAGYLDCNMVVILNDTQHALHQKLEQAPTTSVNAISSALSKLQSSKLFRKLRELAKAFAKSFGGGMYEWAAKVDEYTRGMIGPKGSTLFEELGMYYIGPVDGHNIEDLVCVLNEVASFDSMGPVLIHVVTKGPYEFVDNPISKISEDLEGSSSVESLPRNFRPQTYSDHFVRALVTELERDEDIVVVHAGMGMETSFIPLKHKLADKFFDVGMAEQHAVTFSAGLSCGGLKPFCLIPSAFLQRAYDQVVHDVDRQKIPVRFVITSAGLVGYDGAAHSGSFDITFMSCLPNMIVMAPIDQFVLYRLTQSFNWNL